MFILKRIPTLYIFEYAVYLLENHSAMIRKIDVSKDRNITRIMGK